MAREGRDLLHETIIAKDWKEFDKKVKEFWQENRIYSQTDHGYRLDREGNIIEVWGHVFYLPREIKRDVKHPVPVNVQTAPPIDDEMNPKYLVKCTVCSAPWHIIKYAKCINRHDIEGVPEQFREDYQRKWGKKQPPGSNQNSNN